MNKKVTQTVRKAERDHLRGHAHIALSYVVGAYLDSEESDPVNDLLKVYATYDKDVLDRIQFVIVDDCSPSPVRLDEDLDLNVLVLRVTDDITWNQGGARNLGVTYARSDKLLVTDLDHEMSEHAFRRMIAMRNPGRKMYKMRRIDHDDSDLTTHSNTFVLSRARFLRLYGCDEEFAGHYGYEDTMFWRWQRNHGTRFVYLPKDCTARFRRAYLHGPFHTLERDKSRNERVAGRKKDQWNKYGFEAGHSRAFLNFSWEIIEDRQRRAEPPEPRRHPFWATTWWWRWLIGGTR